MRNAVIVDAVRTASGKGKPGGALSGTHPNDQSRPFTNAANLRSCHTVPLAPGLS
jgi:hypothetical protein